MGALGGLLSVLAKFIQSVLALDGVVSRPGRREKFRVFGTVFQFYGENRFKALFALCERRMLLEQPDRYWTNEQATETRAVDPDDAKGLGFYRVRTWLNERRPETTDVRYGWSE